MYLESSGRLTPLEPAQTKPDVDPLFVGVSPDYQIPDSIRKINVDYITDLHVLRADDLALKVVRLCNVYILRQCFIYVRDRSHITSTKMAFLTFPSFVINI